MGGGLSAGVAGGDPSGDSGHGTEEALAWEEKGEAPARVSARWVDVDGCARLVRGAILLPRLA